MTECKQPDNPALQERPTMTNNQHGQAPARHQQPAPAGAALPEGWVPLVITHEGLYPEEIAYGPQRMMDRLGKWLRKYFDTVVANKAQPAPATQQAGEYPALVCDYCGALTPDPWHSSGMLHGKMSKHIHSCDACAAPAGQVMVPVEPTKEMIEHAHQVCDGTYAGDVYRAMVSAAPKSAPAAPIRAIETLMNQAMAQAVANWANSVSMPDEIVEVAHWLVYRASPPAEQQEKHTCTCPSGDGSLRWPCPQHPVEQAVLKVAPGELAESAAKGAIMGAAYDFRDAHISGSMNLKRSAHAALEAAVDSALVALAAPQQKSSQDTMYLLRRLLSNQHTLTGSEFRAELEKIVGEAYQQEAQEPALFVSSKQLAALTDPDDPDGEHGRYLPVRKTTKGPFTQALYTAPQPAPAPADNVVRPPNHKETE